jgi:hypothetical protein
MIIQKWIILIGNLKSTAMHVCVHSEEGVGQNVTDQHLFNSVIAQGIGVDG